MKSKQLLRFSVVEVINDHPHVFKASSSFPFKSPAIEALAQVAGRLPRAQAVIVPLWKKKWVTGIGLSSGIVITRHGDDQVCITHGDGCLWWQRSKTLQLKELSQAASDRE